MRSVKVLAMQVFFDRLELQRFCFVPLLILVLCTAAHPLHAQEPSAPAASTPAVPDWAQPGSPTHVQVPPAADVHRPSRDFDALIGVFQGQSDIGAAVVPGSANYDANTKQYTRLHRLSAQSQAFHTFPNVNPVDGSMSLRCPPKQAPSELTLDRDQRYKAKQYDLQYDTIGGDDGP